MAGTAQSWMTLGFDPPFTVLAPAVLASPFVFCSPHSGRLYPDHFLAQSRLDPQALRKSEDYYVDDLFACVAALGAPLISAHFPRAYLDVNREPYELDPELFCEPLPDWANAQSIRVVGGLGTIARIVADGEEIYRAPLHLSEALHRIEQLYKPFHEALTGLIDAARAEFGYAILVDCHSMPSSLLSHTSGPRPDIVIGDRFGTSCDPRLSRAMKTAFASLGYDVQMNRPYAGGYITEHYGRPPKGTHALQIEINRGLYVNESTFEKTAGFANLKIDLADLIQQLFAIGPQLMERRAAAE
jgi:N-formylglutamate amidohydrolase